ncbi:MAG TPA: type II secretion system protein [Candidatus Saccharimonadales bacterium]|nr:type II secretion system protein [Candidatus Saccharimonadales bacterium]
MIPRTTERSRAAGFTLVELLVTIILLTVVALALTNFIANWVTVSSRSQARADLLANAENALDTINTDIRLSGNVDDKNRWSDNNAPAAPTDLQSWVSGASTIVLAKAAVDHDRNVIFSDTSKYISLKDNVIYFVKDGTLYKRVLASDNANDAALTTCPAAVASTSCPVDSTITTGVKSFSVKYYDLNNIETTPSSARSVQLSITLETHKGGQTVTASYSTRMVFRNV